MASWDPIAITQGPTQYDVARVGIALRASYRLACSFYNTRQRWKRRLVGCQQSDVPTKGIAVGRRLDGDTADSIGKLKRHSGEVLRTWGLA